MLPRRTSLPVPQLALPLALLALSLAPTGAHAQEAAPPPPVASAPAVAPAPPVAAPAVAPAAAPPAATGATPAPSLTPLSSDYWYGWQILAADGSSILSNVALAVASGGSGIVGPFAGWSGLAGYGLAAPIIHLAHGRPLIALLDLAIRAGAPVLGGYLGAATSNCHHSLSQGQTDEHENNFCGLDGFVLGVTIGAVAAIAIDASALSRTTIDAPHEPAPKASSAFTIGPDLVVARDHGGVGIRGTF